LKGVIRQSYLIGAALFRKRRPTGIYTWRGD